MTRDKVGGGGSGPLASTFTLTTGGHWGQGYLREAASEKVASYIINK